MVSSVSKPFRGGKFSTNTTTTPLGIGGTFTGIPEQSPLDYMFISAQCSHAVVVYLQFSNEGEHWSTFPPQGFTLTPGVHKPIPAFKGDRLFRLYVTNPTGEECTYLRIYTYYADTQVELNAPLIQSVADDSSATLNRSILLGRDERGNYINVPTSRDGLKTVITGPVSSFGELLTAKNFPLFQLSAFYGISNKMRVLTSGAGAAAGVVGNDFYATSGTSSTGNATIFSKAAAIYKSGQGLSYPFTARYSTPQADSVMWVGPMNGSDGITLGYLGLVFGVFFRHWGQHEIRTLTVNTPANGATNATIVIGGVSYTVALTAGTTAFNAKQIADSLTSQTSSFLFQQVDNTVTCRASSARVVTNTFTFTAGATATATWTSQSTGVAITEVFTPIDEFTEGDFTWITQTNGNVFWVDLQYLGYGDIDIYIEYSEPKVRILMHRIHYANENQRASLTNPSLRLGWSAGNRGNTTPVTCYGASGGAFLQGELVLGEPSRSVSYGKSTSTEIVLFSIKIAEIIGDKVSLVPVLLQAISALTESTKGAIFKIVVNPTLAGTPNWTYIEQGVSVLLVDTAATTYTGGRVAEEVRCGVNGRDKDLTNNGIWVLPGDIVSVTAQVTSGAASLNTASLTIKENM